MWERNLCRLDKPLDADCAVCELHFEPHFVVRDYVHIINGAEVRVPRGKPTLRPDTVLTILPNMSSYLSKKKATPRPLTKRRQFASDNDGKIKRRCFDQSKAPSPDEQDECATAATDNNEADDADDAVIGAASEPVASLDDLQLAVPSRSWALHEFPEFNGVSYVACKLNFRKNVLAIERSVFFRCTDEGSVDCEVFVRNKTAEKCRVVTVTEATDALQRAASIPLCCGAVEASSLSELTRGLRARNETREGVFFSVKCMGKSTKEGETRQYYYYYAA